MTDKVWPNGYISGHCLQKNCYGTRNLSLRGAAMPSCTMPSSECSCNCHKLHEQMTQFLEEQGMAIPLPEPVPVVPLRLPSMGTDTPREDVIAAPAVIMPVRTDPRLPPDHPADRPEPVEASRRPKGQLEWDVKQTCDKLVLGGMLDSGLHVTPKLVSEMINPDSPPSTGAIDAVWRRWARMGFATTAAKPTRFTGYTRDGIELGLHRMRREIGRTEDYRRVSSS